MEESAPAVASGQAPRGRGVGHTRARGPVGAAFEALFGLVLSKGLGV